jgi:tetratricopeptide (TPR) repeat protein
MNSKMSAKLIKISKLMSAEDFKQAFTHTHALLKMAASDKFFPARENALLHNLAGECLLNQSDIDKAEKYFLKALSLMDNDPVLSQLLEKGNYLANLASSKHTVGNAKAGDSLYHECAKIQRSLLKPDSPQIAALLLSYGDEAAHDEFVTDLPGTMVNRAIELAEFLYQPGYPACIALEGLATQYQMANRPCELKLVLLHLVEQYSQLFGKLNHLYGDICFRLAPCLEDDPNAARACYNAVLAIQTRLCVADPEVGIACLDNLAALDERAGDLKQAETSLTELLDFLYELTPNSPRIPDILGRLALNHQFEGDFTKALSEQERAIVLTAKDEASSNTLSFRVFRLGTILHSQGCELNNIKIFRKAASTYERAIRMIEKHSGRRAGFLTEVLERLAKVQACLHESTKAISLYKRALSIRRSSQGSDHPEVADNLNDLALVYLNQGNTKKACHEFRLALTIVETAYGPDDSKAAMLLRNYAIALAGAGRPGEGIKMAERALKIEESTSNSAPFDLVATIHNLAGLQALANKIELAKKTYDRAIRLAEEHFEPTSTLRIMITKERDALNTGRFNKPLESFWRQEAQSIR